MRKKNLTILLKKIDELGYSLSDFCRYAEINYATGIEICHNRRTPNIFTALKIMEISEGTIELEDMLSSNDQEKLNEFKKSFNDK